MLHRRDKRDRLPVLDHGSLWKASSETGPFRVQALLRAVGLSGLAFLALAKLALSISFLGTEKMRRAASSNFSKGVLSGSAFTIGNRIGPPSLWVSLANRTFWDPHLLIAAPAPRWAGLWAR